MGPISYDTSHYQKFTPPFEIPDSWEWVILEDITSKIGSGSTPKGSNYSDTGFPFFRSQNVYNDGLVYEDIKYISKEIHHSMKGTIVQANDLLLNITGGSIGRCAIVPNDFKEGNVSQHVCIVRPIIIYNEYLHSYILSDLFWESMKLTGSGREGLPKYNLEQMRLPLPPIEEQVRICQKIKECEHYISSIEEHSSRLVEVIGEIKSKILELAMRGKLVPQDPTEEPASDMLRRINPKARIITDNPHSWNIPESWAWVRIKDVFNPMERSLPQGEKFKYIDIDSIDNKKNRAFPKEIPSKNAPSRASRKTWKGDVLFSMVRPYLRNIAVVPEDYCIASTGFYVLNATEAINKSFAFLMSISPYFVDGLNTFMKGDNSPSINKSNVEDFIIGLPPLNEQKRIVAKIEDLYAVLDEIETSLQ